MSFGAVVASVAGAAASSYIGSKLNKSGGQAVQGRLVSDEALRSTPAVGFNSTGGTATFTVDPKTQQRQFGFRRSAGVDAALADLRSAGLTGARQFAAFRSQLSSGFNPLRQSRSAALAANRIRTIGGLRESLRQRRLGGSSFEQLAVTEANARFTEIEDQMLAEIGIAELEMGRQLIDSEFQASLTGLAETIQQFNFETEVVANLTNQATALQGTIVNARAGVSQTAAEAEAATQAGKGALLQPVIDIFGNVVEGAVGAGIDKAVAALAPPPKVTNDSGIVNAGSLS